MKFFILCAGVPNEVYDAVRKERSFIGGANTTVELAGTVGVSGTPYSTTVVNGVLKAIKARTDADDKLIADPPGYAVIYVGGQNDAALTAALFPAILALPVEWSLANYSPEGIAQSKNELVLALRRQAISARATLEVLAAELTSQAQRTPWLLPLKNFRSKHLRNSLAALASELPAADDKLAKLKAHNNSFRQLHPPQSNAEGHYKERDYFVDDAGLEFRPPGKMLHGYHLESDQSQCNLMCHIAARRRLGAPYLKTFHYDCTNGPVPTSAWLCSCHSTTPVYKTAPKNFNLAPNDYTRP